MKVKKTGIPEDSLTNNYLPANYTDAFSCNFCTDKELTADDIQIAVWTDWPAWIKCMFSIRNSIVKIVGLKGDNRDPEEIKDCIRNSKDLGMFSIADKSQNETVVKLSDKHLDAYMSVYLTNTENNHRSVTVITIVDIHNRLGYIYFYTIAPFHKIVVKGMLKHVIKKITV